MKTAKDIQKELQEMEARSEALRTELEIVVRNVVNSFSCNPRIKRVSSHIVIVKASDLIGNPWNYEFYDWRAAGDTVLECLKNIPAIKWTETLTHKLEATPPGKPVIFERNTYLGGKIKIPLSREFIENIIAELKK